MAAWREPGMSRTVGVAFVIYIGAMGGLLGMILWKLWTEVLAR
jgi:ABC-type transport system involved in cytochrome c biogenesis permease subunit